MCINAYKREGDDEGDVNDSFIRTVFFVNTPSGHFVQQHRLGTTWKTTFNSKSDQSERQQMWICTFSEEIVWVNLITICLGHIFLLILDFDKNMLPV